MFIGQSAGQNNTTGYGNTFLGYQAGQNVVTTYGNTIVGSQAGTTSMGINNTIVGQGAGPTMAGNWNTLIGQQAGVALLTGGNNNIIIGQYSGFNCTTGTQNLIIGNSATLQNATDTNEIVIGYNATGNGSNTITLGNSSTTQTIINYTVPATTDALQLLRVSGDTVKIISRFWIPLAAYQLVASYRLQWYSDTFDMGIIRGPGTGSAGWGVYYNATTASASSLLFIGYDGLIIFSKYTTNGTLSVINGTGQVSSSSDIRLKNNITYVNDTSTALTHINNLKPATFCFNGSTDLN
jgi:hypothetical protein